MKLKFFHLELIFLVFSARLANASECTESGGKCVPYWKCDMPFALSKECDKVNHLCCGKNIVYEENLKLKCGKRNPNGLDGYSPEPEDFLTDKTKYGEWPHFCFLYTTEPIGTSLDPTDQNQTITYVGGASLIDANVVLTVAHKVISEPKADPNIEGKFIYKKRPYLHVRCGDWDNTEHGEPRSPQDRPVAEVVWHPSFNHENAYYDTAVLFLKDTFKLDELISPACLPEPGHKESLVTKKQLPKECYVQGYGKVSHGVPLRTQPKELSVNLVPHKECQNRLRNTTRLGEYFDLHSSFLCASGEKDTCFGDGGSPLVCLKDKLDPNYDPDVWVQVGLTAWGIGCGNNGIKTAIPGVYASTEYVTCWIDEKATEYFNSKESYFGLGEDDC